MTPLLFIQAGKPSYQQTGSRNNQQVEQAMNIGLMTKPFVLTNLPDAGNC